MKTTLDIVEPVATMHRNRSTLSVWCVSATDEELLQWQDLLCQAGMTVECKKIETAASLLQWLTNASGKTVALVVLDRITGVGEMLQEAQRCAAHVPVILVGDPGNEEAMVEGLRAGAMDYVVRDNLARLPSAVERSLREAEVRQAARQAELSLRASEERFRCLSMSSPVGIFMTDTRGHVVYTNPRFRTILGLTFMETLGERWIRAVLAQDRERLLRDWFTAVRDSRDLSVEFRVKTTDGTVRWVHVRSAPMRSDNGVLQGHVGTIEDIHERKQSEAALRESEERFRSVVFNARDIIFTLDTNGSISSLNPAFESVTGWRLADWQGKMFSDLAHPDDLTVLVEKFWRVSNGERVEPFELRIRSESGKFSDCELTMTPQVERQRMVGVMGIARDITDRKRLEEQLAQSQKMEAVGQLAGGVAHDFNNILTAITGYSDMMMRKLRPDDPLYPNAEQIGKAAERASGLTRQLLAFSRKQVLRAEVVDMNAVVADISKMLQRLIGEHIELITRTRKPEAPVKADRGQIEQVILNMAVNARDAMAEKGRLIIETDVVEVTPDGIHAQQNARTSQYVLMRISDTGMGMTPEIKARIFEPFFTTKDKGKGTGLGLATCYGIVRQTGGFITVDSAAGRGTTFNVYLPRSEQNPVREKKIESDPDLPRGRERLLLVEDEMAVRELAMLVLSDLGYDVLTATNGEEALRVAAQNSGRPIDLMITDVVMPLMGGKELSERMRQAYPNMKVMFSSGYTSDAVSERGILAEGISFLQKPYTPKVLARKVREILDGRG